MKIALPKISRFILSCAMLLLCWVAKMAPSHAQGQINWELLDEYGTLDRPTISQARDSEIYIAAHFKDSAKIGDKIVKGDGSIVARLNAAGQVQWIVNIPMLKIHKIVASNRGGVAWVAPMTENWIWDSITILHEGQLDIVTGFINVNGSLRYASHWGGPFDEVATNIQLNGQDFLFMCGYYSQLGSFGGTTVTSEGGEDAYLMKIDTLGQLDWLRRMGSVGADRTLDMDGDLFGNQVVVGFKGGELSVDGIATLGHEGGTDGFAIRIDYLGNLMWSRNIGGPGDDEVVAVSVNAAGAPILSAFLDRGGVKLGNLKLQRDTTKQHWSVTKLDYAKGALVWSQYFDRENTNLSISDMTIDSKEDTWILGEYNGPFAPLGWDIMASGSNRNVFLLKVRANGNPQWLASAVSNGNDSGFSISQNFNSGSLLASMQLGSNASAFGTSSIQPASGVRFFSLKESLLSLPDNRTARNNNSEQNGTSGISLNHPYHIQLAVNEQATLYNMAGQIEKQFAQGEEIILDPNAMTAGMHLLQLQMLGKRTRVVKVFCAW